MTERGINGGREDWMERGIDGRRWEGSDGESNEWKERRGGRIRWREGKKGLKGEVDEWMKDKGRYSQ